MARFNNGWIKVYRASILGDIGSNFIRQGLFDALIAFANLQGSTVEWNGKPRKIERGELVTSLKELADLGGVDVKTVARHINYLRLRDTITVEKCSTGTFIRINNFEEYQGQDAEGSNPSPRGMDRHRDDDVHAIGIHIKEIKNIRNKEIKNIYAFDFEVPFKSYPLKVKGAGAEKRFQEQIKTEQDFADLNQAITNYVEYLKIESWRKPKQSFASFLGTKRSGLFWRDWINYDLTALRAKAKNYQNETETDHDAEVREAWAG